MLGMARLHTSEKKSTKKSLLYKWKNSGVKLGGRVHFAPTAQCSCLIPQFFFCLFDARTMCCLCLSLPCSQVSKTQSFHPCKSVFIFSYSNSLWAILHFLEGIKKEASAGASSGMLRTINENSSFLIGTGGAQGSLCRRFPQKTPTL